MALITSKRSSTWGDDLPGELLDVILSNLFGKDRFSFSLVCRRWNAVAAASPYRYSPCLMYYYWRTRAWKFYQYNTLFNVSFPELENAELRCSKYGWLLMLGYNDDLFFFDPSNNRKVTLPCKVVDQCMSLSFFNPPTSSECVVVGIKLAPDSGEPEICTLKHGEDEWGVIGFPTNKAGEKFEVSIGAPVLHRGLIYFSSVHGDVAILDIKKRRVDVNFKCWPESDETYCDIKEQYLVKVNGEDDELFGVFVFDDDREVNVYRLSSDMQWDLVEEGVGDKVLYLSHMSSFGDKARSECMENTIHFPMFRGDASVFYSLSDDRYHSVDGDYSAGDVYGLKRLNRAAWLMPMPAQELTTLISWL